MFKAFVFLYLTGYEFQLETRLFLFVTSGLLLLDFCLIKDKGFFVSREIKQQLQISTSSDGLVR